MNEAADAVTFYAPALFVAFFVMAAMALVIAPISWIYKSCSAHPPAHDPQREVIVFQLRNLAGMLFLSLAVNLWRAATGAAGPMDFLPEAALLGLMIWRFLVHTRGQEGRPQSRLWRESARIALQFGLCVIGWVVTFAAGFSIYLVSLAVQPGDGQAAATAAGFLTGLLWIGTVAAAFFYFKARAPDPAEAMKGYKVHDLLWPVMLAFVALLAPLIVQDFGNSKDFQEMMHSKRPPKRI